MKRKYLSISIVMIGLIGLLFYFNEEKVHTLKSYYPDKKVTDISQYIIRNGDTIFEGKFTQYNTKGNKIAEGKFVNGHIKGKSTYYFDNGIIESIHYRKTAKLPKKARIIIQMERL